MPYTRLIVDIGVLLIALYAIAFPHHCARRAVEEQRRISGITLSVKFYYVLFRYGGVIMAIGALLGILTIIY